jgi:hypothetical protein
MIERAQRTVPAGGGASGVRGPPPRMGGSWRPSEPHRACRFPRRGPGGLLWRGRGGSGAPAARSAIVRLVRAQVDGGTCLPCAARQSTRSRQSLRRCVTACTLSHSASWSRSDVSCRKCGPLCGCWPFARHDHAGEHRLLVDVQSATALVHHLYRRIPD